MDVIHQTKKGGDPRFLGSAWWNAHAPGRDIGRGLDNRVLEKRVRIWQVLSKTCGTPCLARPPLCEGGSLRATILGVLGASWAAFWVLWGSLGYVFGGFGCRLGSMLEALGDPWAPFWRLWGSRGCLWGSLGAPLVAQGAQSQIFPIFVPPIWGSFWLHFGGKNRSKI